MIQQELHLQYYKHNKTNNKMIEAGIFLGIAILVGLIANSFGSSMRG